MRYFARTEVVDNRRFVTCSGSGVSPIYSPVLDEFGRVTLEITGYDDIYSRIQSYAPLTDIHTIIARLKSGDTSVLSVDTPMFGDFTNVPKTMAESLQMVIDGEKQFDSLPVDIKQKFNNDFKQWFATAGSEAWVTKMNLGVDNNAPVVDQKVSPADT